MKYLILSIIIFACAGVTAQDYPVKGKLLPVAKDGFYRLIISPEVAVFLNEDFSNIRIFDENGLEVPYITESGRKTISAVFNSYGMVEMMIIDDSVTRITIGNPSRSVIDNISLLIRNAEVVKSASLAGSDNLKQWYVLKEKFHLSDISNSRAPQEVKIVDFPLSNYAYYSISIDDTDSPPLYVDKVGFYYLKQEDAQYFSVPVESINQRDSARQSMVTVNFDSARYVERVSWNVAGGPYYLRRANLYEEIFRIGKKGRKVRDLDFIASFDLRSGTSNTVDFLGRKVETLVMVVENDDNPPLKFDTCRAYQLNRHLTAWLKQGQTYEVRIGKEQMTAPVYDLPFFRDSVPANIDVVQIEKLVRDFQPGEASSPSFFTNRNFIWAAIILIIILLGIMSFRMVRETNAVGKQ